MYPAARAEQIKVADYHETTGKFSEASDITIVSGDNETIRGWFLQANASRGRFLILLFHGNGGHRGHRSLWYELLHSIDADILAIDYRGYGDSEGQPSEKSLTEDASATWKYATQQLGYSPRQILIIGESLGGGVSVKLASTVCQQEQQPAGLILISTFSSMLDTAQNQFWWLPVRFLLLDKYRSDLEIPNVTCPVLQFHGTADSIVPLQLAKRLHQLTPTQSTSGVEKELVIFEGAGHNDILHHGGAELRQKVFQWTQYHATPK
jgi:pimeloyl-ACP methyl ester carboxylesterase